jgi:hypothetical protein
VLSVAIVLLLTPIHTLRACCRQLHSRRWYTLFELVHSQEHPYDQNIYAQLHGSRVVEGGNRISAGIIRGPGDTWMLDDVVDGDDMGEILLHIRAGDSAK